MTTANEDTPLYGSMGLDRDDSSSASSGGSHDKRLQRERAESILSARIQQLREREERDDYSSSIWAPCRGSTGGHGGTTGRTKSIALVLLTVLSAAVIMSLYVWIPSAADVRAAQDFNIPILGASRKVRNAQDMADRYRDSYLDDDDDNKSSTSGKKHRNKKDNIKSQDGPGAPPEGCEATVMLIRHCEKGMVREHCSYVGYERSVYLATLFSNDTHNGRWPAPSYIYAQSPSGRHNPKKMNFREYETVAPLAQKLGLDVNEEYGVKSSHKMAREVLRLLQSGEACGKLVLISWKHSDIGHLAHRLGCGPEQGCPLDYRGKTFDEVWQIKFVYDRFRHSTKRDLQLPQAAEWKVFGSVQNEGFDPLAFSKIVGDYPPGGTAPAAGGANWKGNLVQVPERKYLDDRKTWQRAKRQQREEGRRRTVRRRE